VKELFRTIQSGMAREESAANKTKNSGELEQVPRFRIPDLLRRPFDVRSFSLTALFILAIFYTMYFVRAVLLPVVLAMLLSYLFRPVVRALTRIRIPPPLSAAIILLVVIALIGYGVTALAAPAAAWLEKGPAGFQQLQHKLLPVKKSMAQVAQASGEIEKLAAPDAQAKTAVEVKRHPIFETFFARTPEVIAGAVLMLILFYFLLAQHNVFTAKVVKLLPTLSDKKRAVAILNDIETHVSRYLFTVTVINVCLGIAVGTTVGLLGLRNPLMWGTMVAALNFVPYLGALTGIVCMTVGAVLSFESFSYALIFPAVYLFYGTLEGNFVTPWVMGRSLTLNPVLILLSIAFWGWMWGIPGIIVAVPILAAFKIFCTHVEQMAPLAEFLS
jgi:predicted PurR-regulated permease PerM